MPNAQRPSENTGGKAAYLVVPNRKQGAGSGDLVALLQALAGRPEVSVKVQGSPDQPVRLELQTTESVAAELRAQFGSRLIIEPDAPLRY